MNNLAQRKISKDEFKMHMRKLWLDHIYWTRLFIISSLSNLPDSSETASRLIRNQKDIGDLIGSFYKGYGEAITKLLTQHILIAAEYVSSFGGVGGAGNRRTAGDIRKSWYKNADDISDTLYKINRSWNLRQHLYRHLQLTEAEISKRMEANYEEEIKYADEAINQSKQISDVLSNGIIQQFPSAFDGYNFNGLSKPQFNNTYKSNNNGKRR